MALELTTEHVRPQNVLKASGKWFSIAERRIGHHGCGVQQVERLTPEFSARTKAERLLKPQFVEHADEVRSHRGTAEGSLTLRFCEHHIMRIASSKETLSRPVRGFNLVGARCDPNYDNP